MAKVLFIILVTTWDSKMFCSEFAHPVSFVLITLSITCYTVYFCLPFSLDNPLLSIYYFVSLTNNQVNVIFFHPYMNELILPWKPVFDFPLMWELTQKPEQKNHLFLSVCFLDFLWGIKERIWSIDCRMLELKRLSETLLFTYLSLPMRKWCFCSWWKFFFVYCFSLEEILC